MSTPSSAVSKTKQIKDTSITNHTHLGAARAQQLTPDLVPPWTKMKPPPYQWHWWLLRLNTRAEPYAQPPLTAIEGPRA